jgi:ATP-dependent DNA helicase RecG
MFKAVKRAGLPDPKITANHSEFELMFMKDIYTEEYLRNLGLNERQIELIKYIKNHGVITLSTARNLIPTVSEKTLYRDLQDLVKKEILKEMGDKKGRKYAFL